jgi:hypothetical protein
MANIVFNFDSEASLYNAISLANNMSGNHQITVRYAATSPSRTDLSSIDTGSNGYLEQTEIDTFINSTTPTAGVIAINPVDGARLIRPENLQISDPATAETLGNAAIGMAPRIKKSMTIDFLSPSGAQYYSGQGSKLEIISSTLSINPRPYTIATDLTAAAAKNFFQASRSTMAMQAIKLM